MVAATYQYPQYLYALKNGEAVQTANGSWRDGRSKWELKSACREETNGKGSTIQTADGEAIVFGSLVQIPKGAERIDEGTEVLVLREEIEPELLLIKDYIATAKRSGLIVAGGTCKKYDSGRLHCRMWI